ncbi:hypothetical protein KQX54_009674 [Cotesia glomerata]|uniref:Uncharacterized protein n=1 Tax=Cotesia glomerata TaxID=32391 RepID=A0AAV7IMD4_COTGL|nr:hypothetical protein KQX54_009674 [Cotesia glomerata]
MVCVENKKVSCRGKGKQKPNEGEEKTKDWACEPRSFSISSPFLIYYRSLLTESYNYHWLRFNEGISKEPRVVPQGGFTDRVERRVPT